MPRVSFAQEFKSSDPDRFPKLKLDRGEKSRLWIPGKKDTDGPWMEWYHRIEAPMIENGELVMEVKDTRRGPIETWKMDWIGNVFCLGETGTPEHPGPLMLAGIDPGNCPACESADKKTGVAPPQQRFALPVVKFKVRGRGQNPYELASPISAEVLVWAYTSRIHGMLHELEAEHDDLHRHDLKLELEDSPGADTYQKIKQLAVIVKPAYSDPKVRQYLRDLWSNTENRPTDDQLRDACLGRDMPRMVMMDMVRRAERQYRQAELAGTGGGDASAADAGFNGDLSEGIDSLLDSGPRNEEALARVREMKEVTPGDPWADLPAEFEEETGNGTAPADPAGEDIDSIPGHPGGMEEFMSEEEKRAQFAAIEEAKRQAAQEQDPDMLEDLESQTVPEKPKQNGRKKAPARAAVKDEPSLDVPEPETAKVAPGAVIDFDDLFD